MFARGCDSGNCTFSSVDGASLSTVAVSHVCEDINGLLRLRNGITHFNDTYDRLRCESHDAEYHQIPALAHFDMKF